jgi:hypothetical protein
MMCSQRLQRWNQVDSLAQNRNQDDLDLWSVADRSVALDSRRDLAEADLFSAE